MMTPPELYFQKIRIRRMPGFPDGGFTIDDLCPGVNIVYGPNASGKTTLSRAIQKLLRPQEPPHESRSLIASLRLNGKLVTIDYDLGRTHCQRDGFDEDCPSFGPAEMGNRYVLALHDLIRSEDGSDLAAEILRESAGGYDVNAAKEALGFKDRASGKGKSYKELEGAIERCREARKRQDELLTKEGKLSELCRQRETAQRAADQIEWLDKAMRCQEAKESHQQAAKALETFPEGLAQLTGREVEDLERLQELLDDAREKLAKAHQKAQIAKKQLTSSRLPEEGVAPGLIGELRLKCQKLRQMADNIEVKEGERSEAATKAAYARQALGGISEEEKLGRWDADIIDELAKFARRSERTRAEKHAIESLIKWLQAGSEDAPPGDPEMLNQAIRLLHRWLAYGENRPAQFSSRRVLLVSAGITVATSIAMCLLVHWSWILLLVVAAGLTLWAFWPQQDWDRRADIRREFRGLGVNTPGQWTDEAVQTAIRELQRRSAVAYLDKEKTVRRDDLESQSQKVATQYDQLEKEKTEWTKRLGVPIDNENPDESWLYYLVEHGVEYQKANAAVGAADKSLEHRTERYASRLREVNDAISPYGYERGKDPEQVSSFVEDLDQRVQTHEDARHAIAATEEALQEIEGDIQRWDNECTKVFERAGLTEDQEPTLREWTRIYPEYLAATGDLRDAKRDYEAAETALAGHAELTEIHKDELVEMRRHSHDLADKLEELNLQIGGIQSEISNAKRASDLEAALADEAECADALRRQRDVDYDLVAGHVLAEFLARRERDRERPAVFKSAQKLFVDITHGHFRLDIDESDPPAFRAFDTRQQRGLALDELSSGTRLQLLLAVKLAFIERQEQGPKLPLILDETLGNSDERRAREIIDAAIEVCSNGRQVFYLTAQYDEVGKWTQILAEQDCVSSKLVNLAVLRELEDSKHALPVITSPAPVPDIPTPEGCSWLEYGQRLHVPAYDLQSESGRIHLWYLVDDLPALHTLLRQGITSWGQLKTLVQYGSVSSIGSDSPLYRRAEASVRLLEAAARYWRIGRGRPVDRQVLIESGAVSDTFIDRVSDLAARLDGDVRALLAALDSGEIKGFRLDKRNDLAEHLSTTGYLDDREPMTIDQVREQVRAVVFGDIEQGWIDAEQLEHLLAIVLRQ